MSEQKITNCEFELLSVKAEKQNTNMVPSVFFYSFLKAAIRILKNTELMTMYFSIVSFF